MLPLSDCREKVRGSPRGWVGWLPELIWNRWAPFGFYLFFVERKPVNQKGKAKFTRGSVGWLCLPA